MQRLIHHIIVVWDESDHVSAKKSSKLSDLFWNGYYTAFPEASGADETPMVLATRSPMFELSGVKSFLHEGQFIPYAGKDKDLAIVKYCATGFTDQDERFHFIVDDMQTLRYRKGDSPMHAADAVMVVFVTSDIASGMNGALKYITSRSKPNRTNFSCLQTDKSLASGDQRMTKAGYILGMELKSHFIRVEKKGLLLEIKTISH